MSYDEALMNEQARRQPNEEIVDVLQVTPNYSIQEDGSKDGIRRKVFDIDNSENIF